MIHIRFDDCQFSIAMRNRTIAEVGYCGQYYEDTYRKIVVAIDEYKQRKCTTRKGKLMPYKDLERPRRGVFSLDIELSEDHNTSRRGVVGLSLKRSAHANYI